MNIKYFTYLVDLYGLAHRKYLKPQKMLIITTILELSIKMLVPPKVFLSFKSFKQETANMSYQIPLSPTSPTSPCGPIGPTEISSKLGS